MVLDGLKELWGEDWVWPRQGGNRITDPLRSLSTPRILKVLEEHPEGLPKRKLYALVKAGRHGKKIVKMLIEEGYINMEKEYHVSVKSKAGYFVVHRLTLSKKGREALKQLCSQAEQHEARKDVGQEEDKG